MDHEPQWESLAAEEQEQLLAANGEADRKASTGSVTQNNVGDLDDDANEGDNADADPDASIQKPVRSLKDSAPLSSCSEITLDRLETMGLLEPYQHGEDVHV